MCMVCPVHTVQSMCVVPKLCPCPTPPHPKAVTLPSTLFRNDPYSHILGSLVLGPTTDSDHLKDFRGSPEIAHLGSKLGTSPDHPGN